MALTTLDPNTALIIVDLQKGIVGLPVIHPIDGVIKQARPGPRLPRTRPAGGARQCRRRRARPHRTAAPGSKSSGRMDRSDPGAGPAAQRYRRHQADLGSLRQYRSRRAVESARCHPGRDRGVATGTGVESTARQAYEQGFNVTLALDAMTDTRAEAHDHSTQSVFPRLGETGTTAEIVNLLPPRNT